MRGSLGLVTAALAAGLLFATAAGCGSAKVEVSAAGGANAPQKKKHVDAQVTHKDVKAVQTDEGEKKAVEAKVHVKQYEKITVKDDEVDLNPGVAINFQSGSDKLTDDSYPVLYEIWSFLSDNPDVRIRVEGNTDSSGDPVQNRDLSWNRAAQVVKFFIDSGIEEARVDAYGCGQDNPVSYEDSSDAKAMNRRVDFIIAKDKSVICGGVYDPPAEGAE